MILVDVKTRTPPALITGKPTSTLFAHGLLPIPRVGRPKDTWEKLTIGVPKKSEVNARAVGDATALKSAKGWHMTLLKGAKRAVLDQTPIGTRLDTAFV